MTFAIQIQVFHALFFTYHVYILFSETTKFPILVSISSNPVRLYCVALVEFSVNVTLPLVHHSGSNEIVHVGVSFMSLFTVNVQCSDSVSCPKLSVATTYRVYVQFGNAHGLIHVDVVVQDCIISSHDKIYIVYPLIVAQLSPSDPLHVNSIFELDIVSQLFGLCNSGAVGHVLTIHVTSYANAIIFHAASLIYPVQLVFSVTVNVLFPVQSSSPVPFRAYANSGYQDRLSHVFNFIVTLHVVQLFTTSQLQSTYVTFQVGHAVSIV